MSKIIAFLCVMFPAGHTMLNSLLGESTLPLSMIIWFYAVILVLYLGWRWRPKPGEKNRSWQTATPHHRGSGSRAL